MDWVNIGVWGAGVGAVVMALYPLFIKRKKTVRYFYQLFSIPKKALMNYDIPVIGGKSEESFKESFLSTVGDMFYAGWLVCSGKELPDEFKKDEKTDDAKN